MSPQELVNCRTSLSNNWNSPGKHLRFWGCATAVVTTSGRTSAIIDATHQQDGAHCPLSSFISGSEAESSGAAPKSGHGYGVDRDLWCRLALCQWGQWHKVRAGDHRAEYQSLIHLCSIASNSCGIVCKSGRTKRYTYIWIASAETTQACKQGARGRQNQAARKGGDSLALRADPATLLRLLRLEPLF